jgi:hypothetical protein
VAVGGELARRPARAACVIPRTAEIDDAEEVLYRALLAVIVGNRRAVTTEEVAQGLEEVHDLAPGAFSVHCHMPEDFLIFFAAKEVRDRVLGEEVLSSPFFRLILRPWTRRTHAASGGLCVHAEVEIEGVPANVWNLSIAEAVLAPAAWVERLHPLTRSRADMGVFRLSAWCLDPATIAREVDLHVVEPDDPPSAVDMASPAQVVVPPHVNTLAYPLLVHVVRTTDFRRPVPRTSGNGGDGAGNGGATAWPTRRHYPYTPGTPDFLPGSGSDGAPGGSSAPTGGGGGGTGGRTLASGVVVEAPAPAIVGPRGGSGNRKRSRRGGRQVRERRLRTLAVAAGTDTLPLATARGAMEPTLLLSAPANNGGAEVETGLPTEVVSLGAEEGVGLGELARVGEG